MTTSDRWLAVLLAAWILAWLALGQPFAAFGMLLWAAAGLVVGLEHGRRGRGDAR